MEVEQEKLKNLLELSSCLNDLKTKQNKMEVERTIQMKTKCEMMKNMRLEEFKQKSNTMSEKEKELCQKTNRLLDELVAACDDSPFHKALIKVLGNMKGIKIYNEFFSR